MRDAMRKGLIEGTSIKLDFPSRPRPRMVEDNPVFLNFRIQSQQQINWCWAAVTTSICLYYNRSSSVSQCSMANSQLGQTTCCADGSTDACNRGFNTPDALQSNSNLRESASGMASRQRVIDEVVSGTPPCMRIQWPDQSTHAVVIQGFFILLGGDFLVHVEDPFYGHQEYFPENELYHSYGRWIATFFTKSAA